MHDVLANVRSFTQQPLSPRVNVIASPFYEHHNKNGMCMYASLWISRSDLITFIIYMFMQSVKSHNEIELFCKTFDNIYGNKKSSYGHTFIINIFDCRKKSNSFQELMFWQFLRATCNKKSWHTFCNVVHKYVDQLPPMWPSEAHKFYDNILLQQVFFII